MRNLTAALVLAVMTAAVPAIAQDPAKPEVSSQDAAEEAFLKAYFKEKELKDVTVAEREYAAVIENHPGAREVVARSLLGRARCLKSLKREDETRALLARIGAEFADFKDVAAEAARMAAPAAVPRTASLERIIDDGLRSEEWHDSAGMWVWQHGVVEQGDKAVPILTKYLRGDEPELVCRATWDLLRMDTPLSNAAVLSAALHPGLVYPAQVARGLSVPPLCPDQGFLREALASPHHEIRTACAVRAYDITENPDAWVYDAIVKDPAAVKAILVKRDLDPSQRLGKLLVRAGASGPGPARDAALAAYRRIEFSFRSNPWLAPFLDPPEALLADREAMRVVWRSASDAQGPASPALMQALFDDPETEDAGIHLCFHGGDVSKLKPEQVTQALARHGFLGAFVAKDSQAAHVAVLMQLLGPAPTAEGLRRVASVFPESGDWLRFVKAVAAATRGGSSEVSALLEGTPSPRLKKALLEWLPTAPDAAGAWAVACFLRAIESSDEQVVRAGLGGLIDVRGRTEVDLARHAPAFARLLGGPYEAAAAGLLRGLGESGARELRARVVADRLTSPVVLTCLGEMRDTESAPRIENVLGSSQDEAEIRAAAGALIAIQGDRADDSKLSAAALRAEGKFTRAVLLGVASGAGNLSQKRLGDFFCNALERAPGRFGWLPPDMGGNEELSRLVRQFPTDVLRRIALAALKSPAVEDRRWGAAIEIELLDMEAWDALLVAAKDLNSYVRDKSIAALRKIRDNEDMLAELRSIGDERATKERVRTLLASDDSQSRLAGLAAVVATHDETLIPELIRLAAESKDTNVARAAREALLAFGRPATAETGPK